MDRRKFFALSAGAAAVAGTRLEQVVADAKMLGAILDRPDVADDVKKEILAAVGGCLITEYAEPFKVSDLIPDPEIPGAFRTPNTHAILRSKDTTV